ncbi:MAG: DNA-binding protein [Pseudonocardiaceae bacterium]|nr:DNA-binding protein [Pseudonocardiaceae bacterium]
MMVAEIAERSGHSRQRAHTMTRHPLFPTPAAELAAGKVWRWPDVEAFLSLERRPGRPGRPEEDS